MRTEKEIVNRAWPIALSSAEADMLVVCGHADGEFAEILECVWAQLPGPRARTVICSSEGISAALETALAELKNDEHQRHDALTRPDGAESKSSEDGDDAGMGGGQHDHGAMSHGEHQGHNPEPGSQDESATNDHADMGHDEHGGHGGHDMSGPGGIPLASGGPDRDGLDLDVLHVSLGPVMPHWPAGLVLHCSVQGDVVVEAEAAEVLGVEDQPAGTPQQDTSQPEQRRWIAVARCDAVARLLTVAGWEGAAGQARGVRDALLDGASLPECSAPLRRLERRVRRSVLLRWSLRGLPSLSDEGPDGHDILEQLERWVSEARGAVEDALPVDPVHAASSLDSLSALVTGLELASVRLVVAGSGIDTAIAARPEMAHG
ncbi:MULTISPECIES: hypothetical protein [Georgenia]|nr:MULTISPECIES: hypothetical protein [Georgenia]